MSFLRLKSFDSINQAVKKDGLAKTLGPIDLLLLGIGAILGTGIFVLTGVSAVEAGPAVTLSFLFAAVTCMFIALCYTEVSTMIRISGNVYSFAYVGMGELAAWLVGWFLILEYSGGASTVATGWSAYFVGTLKTIGIFIPEYLTKGPIEGGLINLPASAIAFLLSLVLFKGTKESAVLNNILVVIKVAAIMLFIFAALPSVDTANWDEFMPNGIPGVSGAAAVVFFAFIGFDSLASTAEECKNPKRDLTFGIIGSLVVCATLYILVAGILTLIVPYNTLGNTEPLAFALREKGSAIGGAIVAIGGITAMTSVLLVLMFVQSRIFMVMSRDRLLPHSLAKIHPKFKTPTYSVVLIGLLVMTASGMLPTEYIAQLTSMGTLIGFLVVALVMMIMRIKHPKIERPFRCPLVWFVGPVAILLSGFLLMQLIAMNFMTFLTWLVAGLVIYFLYGYRFSNIARFGHSHNLQDDEQEQAV